MKYASTGGTSANMSGMVVAVTLICRRGFSGS
jgi:hypothetical protein